MVHCLQPFRKSDDIKVFSLCSEYNVKGPNFKIYIKLLQHICQDQYASVWPISMFYRIRCNQSLKLENKKIFIDYVTQVEKDFRCVVLFYYFKLGTNKPLEFCHNLLITKAGSIFPYCRKLYPIQCLKIRR